MLVEFSGLNGVVDARGLNSGNTGTTLSRASLTGLSRGDAVVAMVAQAGSVMFTGDGVFTQLSAEVIAGSRSFWSAYHFPAGTTDSTSWTTDTTNPYNTIIAAFKAAGGRTYSSGSQVI